MSDPRAGLPAVQSLLEQATAAGLLHRFPRQLLVDAARAAIEHARNQQEFLTASTDWMKEMEAQLVSMTRPTLQRVINATGVVLHTNLGRAPLARAAVDAIHNVAPYNSLEYDLLTGTRGSRQSHIRPLLCEITGSEDGLAVNNAASAMVLVLNALSAGGETIVSRGELVEIGGSFRIPDILEKSGTRLVEVGTTNRTRLDDYAAAITPNTRCILKVHRSNFQMTGFTEEVDVASLGTLCRDRGIPFVHDIGSGLLMDLGAWGLTGEPMVQTSVAAGATVVFSGDKLVGGPQAGLVVGPEATLQRMATNPFARALRPDKIVLAALEATLALYRDQETARQEIPVLAMLTASAGQLEARAHRIASDIRDATVVSGESTVGGGSFPGTTLATSLVRVPTLHPNAFADQLRSNYPPVIVRVGAECVLADPRTVDDADSTLLVDAIRDTCLAPRSGSD